jgi:hypothetical protein
MATAVEQIGSADIVVAIVPPPSDIQEIDRCIERIVEYSPRASASVELRAVLMHPPSAANGAETDQPHPQWQTMTEPRLGQDRAGIVQSLGDSFRVVFDIVQKLGARACAVIASDLSTVTAEWIDLLLTPAVEGQFDLIAPCYARHPFEGMINRGIVYPLTRALYGKQIRNPLGPDFGMASALVERMCDGPSARVHSLASLTAEAVTREFRVCQAHLGPHRYTTDWTNLSSLLAQVLGPLFLDVERHAAWWQRARTSQPVPEFGQPTYVPGPEATIDLTRLIESFKLGATNLPEVWSMILAPSTLMELRRLARLSMTEFRMPDETWARIVYDFALAHRLRTISRDQMLRAITPIYLGWVASYALEVENATPEFVEGRLEKLCVAYENTRSHFVARWRWPDRFNP